MRQSELAMVARTRARLASGDARAARLKAGVSAAEFARVICVSRTAVGEWEAARKRPTAPHALAYGQLLARVAGLLAVIVVAVAGCSSAPPPVPSPATTVTAEATNPPLASTGPVSVTPVSPPASAPPPKQVSDPGQVTGSLAGMHCAYRGKEPDVLPDPACTPGAFDPKVTAAILCDPAYSTRAYRPPVYQTSRFKLEQAYPAYGLANIPGVASELDHLISLDLGGSNDASNLWPEVGSVPNPKDKVETKLHKWVCQGVPSGQAEARLHEARIAVAADWVTSLQVLGVSNA